MIRVYRISFLTERFEVVESTYCISRNEAVLEASRRVDSCKRARFRKWSRCVVTELDISMPSALVERPIISLYCPVCAR